MSSTEFSSQWYLCCVVVIQCQCECEEGWWRVWGQDNSVPADSSCLCSRSLCNEEVHPEQPLCFCMYTFILCFVNIRPVRMHMDLDTNMRMIGKRYPFFATYKVGIVKSHAKEWNRQFLYTSKHEAISQCISIQRYYTSMDSC